jgi:hypothetical protein
MPKLLIHNPLLNFYVSCFIYSYFFDIFSCGVEVHLVQAFHYIFATYLCVFSINEQKLLIASTIFCKKKERHGKGKMHAWMSPHQKQLKLIAMPSTIDAML